MITIAFCKETGNYINIKNIDSSKHETFFCGNLHPLIPKLGNIKTHHFAHYPNTKCDKKSKSEFHLRYQSLFPKTEIIFQSIDSYHIADIVTERDNRDVIIEIQHSNISKEDIMKRENIYESMIWIFDASYGRTETEFICRDEKYCLLKIKKSYLKNTTKETYYDCGKYLCKLIKFNKSRNVALCEIVQYGDFLFSFPDIKNFEILLQDPLFEFAFIVDQLFLEERKIYFTSNKEEDYSPFEESSYINLGEPSGHPGLRGTTVTLYLIPDIGAGDLMARLPRFVVPGAPHQVQRGNGWTPSKELGIK